MTRHLPDPLAATLLCLLTALATVAALTGLARAEEAESATLRVLVTAPRFQGRLDPDTKEVLYSDADEDDDLRRERLTELAKAIDAATPYWHERKLLLSVGWWESRWASYVQLDDDACRNGHMGACDNGAAYGVTQLHHTKRTESYRWQMRRTVQLLRFFARRCGKPGLATAESVHAAVSGYATGGKTCRWVGAGKRVRTWRRLGGGR